MTFTTWNELETFAPFDGVEVKPIWLEGALFARIRAAAGIHVPAHAHPHRQLGSVLEGSVWFRIGDEERTLRPGDVYAVPGDVEHEARFGPDGCVMVEVFAPEREDWIAKMPSSGS